MGAQYDVSDLVAYDFFNFNPSLALACIALSLFTLAAITVAVLTERRPVYRYMHLTTATGLLEAAAYAALVYVIKMSGKGDIFPAYIIMQVAVIESPNILHATLYWTLGLILTASPQLTKGRRMLRSWVVTAFFASCDVFTIIIQAIGITIWATSQSSGDPDATQIRIGCGVTLAGLALQLVCFAAFVALTIWTHRGIYRQQDNELAARPQTRKLFRGMYLVMVLLTVRNLFRFVEFTQNTILDWPPPESAYVLAEQQVLFYTLDTLPIFLCMVAYIFLHPGYLLPPHGVKLQQKSAAGVEAGMLHGGSKAAGSELSNGKASPSDSGSQEVSQFQVVAV